MVNFDGRATAFNIARLLAIHSQESDRKVVIFDKTEKSDQQVNKQAKRNINGIDIVKIEDYLDLVSNGDKHNSFTAKNFNLTIKNLLQEYDQVYICANKDEASTGIMALESFDTSTVVLSRLRKTKKIDITKFISHKPIDILFL